MKFSFNRIILLENGKIVTAKWYTENIDVLMTLLCIITSTMKYLEAQRIKLISHPAYS